MYDTLGFPNAHPFCATYPEWSLYSEIESGDRYIKCQVKEKGQNIGKSKQRLADSPEILAVRCFLKSKDFSEVSWCVAKIKMSPSHSPFFLISL